MIRFPFNMFARLGLHTLILTFSLATLRAADIPALVQKTKPAVVEIMTFDSQNKPLKTGTGFFVSSDGALLTNFHVISGASSIMAKTPTGAVYFLKNVVVASESDDVAKLQFLANDVPYLTLGSSLNAVEGQRVLVIGNPEGLEGTVSDGIISAFRSGRNMIQITAPISPGSSGSPVLDESGQVIGMATLVSKEGENLNFAISSETIKDAIQSGLARTTPTPAPEPCVAAVTPSPTKQLLTLQEFTHDEYSFEAFCEANEKKYDEAIRHYTKAIQATADFAPAYAGRGWCYLQLGLYEKAIMDLSEAIRLTPDYADVYADRGWCYCQLGLYEKAIMDLSEAIRLQPSNQDLYFNRGTANLDLKQYQSAITDYNEVIRLKPEYADAYYNIGNAYLRLRQYERAIADYTEAIRLQPDMADAYQNRAYSYHMLGDEKAGLSDLKKAKKLGFHKK